MIPNLNNTTPVSSRQIHQDSEPIRPQDRLLRFCLIVFWALCLNSQSGISASGEDSTSNNWSIDRGNLSANGAVSTQLPEDLNLIWTYEAGEPIEATAIVVNQRVFVGDVEGNLHAISLTDGKAVWKQGVDSGYLAPPTADNEMIVIGDYDGFIRAFGTENGTPLWTFETGAEISGGVAFVGSNILASSQDGNLYAVDRKSGKEVWTYQTGDQIRCRPTIATDRTFLGGCDGALHSVSVKSGEAAADPIPLDGPTGSTPAVVGTRAYLPTQSGAVMAFDWKEGKALWTYTSDDRPQEFRNSAAATDEHVIVANKNRQVLSLNPDTGDIQWTALLKRRSDASPVVAGNDVWITSTDGRIYRLDLNTGKEKWQYEVRGSFLASPAVVPGYLVVATDDGKVLCFGKQ